MLRFVQCLTLLIIFGINPVGYSADMGSAMKPVKKSDGTRWRIGYMEGGPYHDYQSVLKAFIKQLAKTGWIEQAMFPKSVNDRETLTLWNWLCHDIKSDFLEFVPDAYWSADWDDQKRVQNKNDAIQRLNECKEIDLMLAFGTHAGVDLANNDHAVNTMLFSSADPIGSGIVKSASDSGYDHFHTRVDPYRYQRQLRLFHEIVGFKKLGVAFSDTRERRTYAALDDIHKVSKELNFQVIECAYSDIKAYSEEEKQALLDCHRKLAIQCDAFYVTFQNVVNNDNLRDLLKPFFEHKIPTFAQGRTFEVQQGVLMSLASMNFEDLAKFHVQIMTRILNGEKPRDIPQLYESKMEIAINLETAKKIGFHFPMDILAGAREIYENIGGPPLSGWK